MIFSSNKMPLLIKHKNVYHPAQIDIKTAVGVLTARFTKHKILSVISGDNPAQFKNVEDIEKDLLNGNEIIVVYTDNKHSYKRKVYYRFVKYYSEM